MRAIYLDSFTSNSEIIIDNEKHHHLVNVVRAKEGDEILLLDGRGSKAIAKILKVDKKKTSVQVFDLSKATQSHSLSVAIGIPKKEAMDLCLKQCVEIGVERIFLVHSDYGQKIKIKEERVTKLIISALEQSNNPFIPEIIFTNSFEELPYQEFDNILLLTSQQDSNAINAWNLGNTLLLIGPEGGFSKEENNYFRTNSRLKRRHLPCHILRTPTAVSVGLGYVIAQHENC
jgi:16S rRNA (uracil1498-N3)-methyltransferase